jgi:hypothetical protein
MQLLNCYGMPDVYLTGNPQITHFKSIYRRHTNFSKDNEIIYNDIINERTTVLPIERNADLLNGITLIIDLNDNNYYKDDIDSYILDNASFFLNNECIQEITKDYINISNKLLYKKSNTKRINNKIIIDIPFWFTDCANALPLISLAYTKSTLKLDFNEYHNIKNLQVIANYLYLDSEERRIFAKSERKYLYIKNFYFENNIDKIYSEIEHEIKIKQKNRMIDIFFIFQNNNTNEKKYFNYGDLSEKLSISLNDDIEPKTFDKIFFTHYMQNRYENMCENVYVQSYTMNPNDASKSSYGYYTSENEKDKITIINHLKKFEKNHTMKIIIRCYDIITINFGVHNTLDPQYVENIENFNKDMEKNFIIEI